MAEIKTVPGVPSSHPFIERLIGTMQREYLDRILFWTKLDLEANYLISSSTTIAIARIAGWKDACRSQSLTELRRRLIGVLRVSQSLSRVVPDFHHDSGSLDLEHVDALKRRD